MSRPVAAGASSAAMPNTAPVALLRAAIRRSGLSNRQFAERVLARDERTVRRWIAGTSPIPDAVVRWLHLNVT